MNLLLSLISPKLALYVLLLAALTGLGYYTYNHVYDSGAQSVQVKWDKVAQERKIQIHNLIIESAKKTSTLQATADKQKKESNEKITALNKSISVIVNGMSDRTKRTDISSNPAGADACTKSGTSCDGTKLYREDAEFLIREAGRAEKLIVDLQECQNQYNAARDLIK